MVWIEASIAVTGKSIVKQGEGFLRAKIADNDEPIHRRVPQDQISARKELYAAPLIITFGPRPKTRFDAQEGEGC